MWFPFVCCYYFWLTLLFWNLSPLFSLAASDFTVKTLIQLPFLWGSRCLVSVVSKEYPIILAQFLEAAFFFQHMFLVPLWRIQCLHLPDIFLILPFAGLCVVFVKIPCWFCYHGSMVELKSSTVIPTALLFWLNTTLAIKGLLSFHVNFRVSSLLMWRILL